MDEKKLCSRLERWLDEGKYQDMVNAFYGYRGGTEVPRAEAGEVYLLGGMGEIRLAEQKLRENGQQYTTEILRLLEFGVSRLKEYQDLIGDIPVWYSTLAEAAMKVEREPAALGAFEVLMRLEPDCAEWREKAEQCRRKMNLPLFQVPCSARMAQVWREFSAWELDAWRKVTRRSSDARDATRRLWKSFDCLFQESSASMYVEPDSTLLIQMDAGAAPGQPYVTGELLRRQPPALSKRWKFEAGMWQPDAWFSRKDMPEVAMRDVTAAYERDRFGMYRFQLHAPLLLQKIPWDEDAMDFTYGETRTDLALTGLLERKTGDLFMRRYCTRANAVTSLPPGPSCSLEDLPAALKKQGIEIPLTLDRCVNTWEEYDLEGDPEHMDWRSGRTRGKTCAMPLLRELYTGESTGVDEIHRYGAAAGSICFPLSSLRGAEAFEPGDPGRLAEQLQKQVPPEHWRCTGWGAGETEGYIDLIAWDTEAFLKALRPELQKAGIRDFSFRSMRSRAQAVPEEDWPRD